MAKETEEIFDGDSITISLQPGKEQNDKKEDLLK